MTEDWAATYTTTLAQNEISDVHTPWDDEPTVTGRLRATDNLASSYPQRSRVLPQSAYTTRTTINPIFPGAANTSFLPTSPHWGEVHMTESAIPKGSQSHGFSLMVPPLEAETFSPLDHDVPLHSAAQSTSVQRDTSGNFGTAAIHAVRRPKPCPPGYKKRPFTNKMAHEIARRHSIPYQEVCQYYHYNWVDELYHHCPIADCTSGQNTFRGDTIKTHLEHYHPNITVEEKVSSI
ncbi:hypothetical protein EV421DRAFT_1738010 [Armillaria borealis]|uniref:Uncharacterized protein n=1 Tax=Armillaria borealis TaxID=47425 RepID=A0AA39JC85_9AGAR|nr:hypothetical protein EV421DRAFT_1738010 [Armillaria borealis]